MSYNFTAANNDYIQLDITALGGFPYTLSVWYKVATEQTNLQGVAGIYTAGNNTAWYTIGAQTVDEVFVPRLQRFTTLVDATTPVPLDQWMNLIAIIQNGSMTIYKDGASSNTVAVSGGASSGWDRLAVGMIRRSSPINPTNGKIAEYALWNKVLTSGEIQSVVDFTSPLEVANANLISYLPLLSNVHDPVRDVDWTVGGSPSLDEDHPGPPLMGRGPRLAGLRNRRVILPSG